MKVSIVMTCFNTSKFVAEAIKSIVDQNYKDWELVIVDDKSTDNTVNVVRETLDKFNIKDKSKVILHDNNYGCGKSLSDAINKSSGELIAVLDSDDKLAPNVLSLVVAAHINNKNVSLVYTNYMVCNSNLQQIKLVKNFQMPSGAYLHHMRGASHLKCFKKSFYNKTSGIDQSLLKSVDKDLILKLEEVGQLYYINTVGYFYREHPNNISNSFFRKPKEKRLEIRRARMKIVENAKVRRKMIGVK